MAAIDPTKIANRALQRLGQQRIATGALFTEDSNAANNIADAYHILRRAEMRRNVWRFSIRKMALRAINSDTMLVVFAVYNPATTYKSSDVAMGSDGVLYQSLVGANLANNPVTDGNVHWTNYFGTTTATEFASLFQIGTTYAKNMLVIGSDTQTYKSLANGNIGHDPTTDGGVHWAVDANDNNAGLAFYAGELVYSGTTAYLSLVSNNTTDPTTDTTGSWLQFTTAPTLSALNFVYPIGSGPQQDSTTKNVFILPNGFLREAPQDPKAGINAFLGGPAGLMYSDWEYENDCFTSFNPGPIVFRFAADISDPTQFDPMFVEGFGCRIAMEMCEILTQSTSKLQNIVGEYKKFMGDARTVNGIETGPVEPPVDEYIAVRA